MIGAAAAGDYDGDGWVDLYVTRIDTRNLLFHNLGDGTFEEVGASAGVDLASRSSACAWGDVNGDGYIDLLVLTIQERQYLYINNGMGGFTEQAEAYNIAIRFAPSRAWTGIAFGDYDLDGDLDVYLTGWDSSGLLNRLYRNEDGTTFVEVTADAGLEAPGLLGFAPSFADVTGDGWVDLLVAADFGTSLLFENLRDGTFRDITAAAGVGQDDNGMGSTVGDVDNDGDLDWFVTSIFDPDVECTPTVCNAGWKGTGNFLYINDGTGHFVDATGLWGVRDGQWGWGTSFLDFDNDGRLDIAEINGISFSDLSAEDKFQNQPGRLWHNNGLSTMDEVGATLGFTTANEGKGLLTFDYDNDGDQDVFVVNNADHPVLYRNDGGNTDAYLRVDARGTVSNAMGIGATVRAAVGASAQMRLVDANSNYMGQNERIVHFGFGPVVQTVDVVTVEWPVSAIVQIRHNVAVDQLLEIHEPSAGDFEDDGDVDLDDYAILFGCFAPPQSADHPPPLCARSTDLKDVAVFQRGFTGPLE